MRPPPARLHASIARRRASLQSLLPSPAAPYRVMSKSRFGNTGALMRARIAGTFSHPAEAVHGNKETATTPKPDDRRNSLPLIEIPGSISPPSNYSAASIYLFLSALKSFFGGIQSACAEKAYFKYSSFFSLMENARVYIRIHWQPVRKSNISGRVKQKFWIISIVKSLLKIRIFIN